MKGWFTLRHALSLAAALGLALAVSADAYAQAQSKDQQACINALNKSLGAVAKTVHKEAEGCIKNQSKAKVPSAQDCLDADAKGKIAKAKQKTVDADAKSCAAQTPDFGATDAATVNAEAEDKEARILQRLFGSDLDAAVATGKAESACQQALTKQLFKCEDTKLKEFANCKKTALKEGATSAAALEACLGADPKGKIAKDCVTKLADTAAKKCVGQNLAALFPGYCAGSSDIVACLETVIECDVCSTVNAADNLNVDCDLFDDGLANESCGACRNASDQAQIEDLQTTVAPACLISCGLDLGCLEACIDAGTDLSAECTTCFSTLIPCTLANCIPECLDPTSLSCLICLNVSGCQDCLEGAP